MSTQFKEAPDVQLRDQDSRRVSVFLGQTLDTLLEVSGMVKDTMTITIKTTGVVPIAGNCLFMGKGNAFSQVGIVTATSLGSNRYTIGLNIPLDHDYPDNITCILQNTEMNVNGSVTPKEFSAYPLDGSFWDICSMTISMVLSSAGDDGKFGNLTALAAGVGQFFRKEDSDTSQNFFCYKENTDLALEGGNILYTTRSGGGGSFGMTSKIAFNGNDESGVVIRLSAITEDRFTTIVRANLSALGKYRIKVHGHVSENHYVDSFFDSFETPN